MNPEKVFFSDNTYFTSDTHFGHRGVIEYSKRPFADREEMDRVMIERWNDTVRSDSTIFHLGDVSLRKITATVGILQQLKGNINLIAGNHDSGLLKKQEFKDFFVETRELAEIQIGDDRIVLCHFPLESWHQMHRGAWHLHGHSHGSMKSFGRRLDVGVDTHDFRPYSFQEVKSIMDARAIESRDHHHPRHME